MNFRPPLPLLGNVCLESAIAVAAVPFVVAGDVAESLFFAVLVLLVSVVSVVVLVVLVVLVVPVAVEDVEVVEALEVVAAVVTTVETELVVGGG